MTFVIMCEVAAGEGGAILRLALNVWMVGQLITVNTPSGTGYRQEIQNDTTRIIMSHISQKSQVMWCQWWVNRLLSTNHPVYNHPHSLYDYLPVVLLDPDQLVDGELDMVVEIVLLIMEVGGSGSYHWCWLILTGWHRLAANIIALRHRESGTTCIYSYIIIIIIMTSMPSDLCQHDKVCSIT